MRVLLILVLIHILTGNLAFAKSSSDTKTIDLKSSQSQTMLSKMYSSTKISKYLNTTTKIDLKISCGWVEVGKSKTCDVEAQNRNFFVTFKGGHAKEIANYMDRLGVEAKGHFANQFASLKCKNERNCDLIELSAGDYWSMN